MYMPSINENLVLGRIWLKHYTVNRDIHVYSVCHYAMKCPSLATISYMAEKSAIEMDAKLWHTQLHIQVAIHTQ